MNDTRNLSDSNPDLTETDSEGADVLEQRGHQLIAEGHGLLARAAAQRITGGVGEFLTLQRAAKLLGAEDDRLLQDEGRKGALRIEGPRGHRVVRRSELDRWLATKTPKRRPAVLVPEASVNDAYASIVRRIGGGS